MDIRRSVPYSSKPKPQYPCFSSLELALLVRRQQTEREAVSSVLFLLIDRVAEGKGGLMMRVALGSRGRGESGGETQRIGKQAWGWIPTGWRGIAFQ